MSYFRLLCDATFFHPSHAQGRRVPAGTVVMQYTSTPQPPVSPIRFDDGCDEEEMDFWLADESGWYRQHLYDFNLQRLSALELLALEAE